MDELLRLADGARDEVVGLARDLVRLETVNTGVMPTGGETAAAESLGSLLRREGIADVELLSRDPDRANLVARLPGEDLRSRLLLLGHSDVVPAGDRSLWVHPPFGAEIAGGRLFGRGAADMKGTVAAEVTALLVLRRAGVRLRHSITLACVADEEAGGAYGMGWLTQEYPGRVRADVSLNEGGGQFVDLDGALHCVVGLGEKGRHEAVYQVAGRGAHASQPWLGENALYPLARLIERLEAFEAGRSVDLPIFPALHALLHPGRFAAAAVTPENVDDFARAVADVAPQLGSACRALSRTTVVPSVVRGGEKSNSVPDRVELRCDVRSLPGQDREVLVEALGQMAEGLPGARFHLETTAHASQSAAHASVFAALEAALRASAGREVRLLPGHGTGFTDSRFARDIGMLAYGCTPGRPITSTEPRNAHGADEWTDVDDLVAMTRFFVAAALELDRVEL